ncbi:GFA family protein [Sphingomonas sp. R-74633]|uniref:GFA family protein n=1 Tax=Sphingomonas sp. R-74633 TaxID=2751188 RepID=UPI0015D35884|nr:GFA family protein [Sphingomonas sp. R-74633]
MTTRTATCRCGQLKADVTGEPVRISVCHCLDCKRRSGSAFSAQARYPQDQVTVTGAAKSWEHVNESGAVTEFHFCTECGGTVWYRGGGLPDLMAIPIGCFADPGFPAPFYSVYEARKHDWLEITAEGVEHYD